MAIDHRVDIFEGVSFCYLGQQLRSVIYGKWPFPLEDGTLGYPGGYPMPEPLLNRVVGEGKTGAQLNEEMEMARDICLEALPRYLKSLKG